MNDPKTRTARQALAAAIRAIGPEPDPTVYKRRLQDFQLGYLSGHHRAIRRATRPGATFPQMAALEQSVRLQSHYAMLLNEIDGGRRKTFANADAWIERLKALEALSKEISAIHTSTGENDE